MNIVLLLAWYEEEPSWLAATITSAARCNIDHVIAVDGAYLLYPNGRNTSDLQQHKAILETTNALGLGCTIHTPREKWARNEVEKRTFMFRLADTLNPDWLWVMDADEIVTHPLDLKAELATTDLHVAEATLWEHHKRDTEQTSILPRETGHPFRCLFRHHPGLHCDTNHYTYRTADGLTLWGQDTAQLEQPHNLTALRIQHRTAQRANERSREQHAYYRQRDQIGIEQGPCDRCHQRPATKIIASGFQDEGGYLTAGHTSVCPPCAEQVHTENEQRITQLGYDPSGLQAHMHQPA